MTEPREFTIELPPGQPLLSLNDRHHWAQRNRIAQALRTAAWAKACAAKIPPLTRVAITITYQPYDRRRRDPDNYAASGKHVIDGLVDAGVIRDDNSAHVAAVRYEIGPLYKLHPRGRLVIHIREELSP